MEYHEERYLMCSLWCSLRRLVRLGQTENFSMRRTWEDGKALHSGDFTVLTFVVRYAFQTTWLGARG
jgi:hypothetical protein